MLTSSRPILIALALLSISARLAEAQLPEKTETAVREAAAEFMEAQRVPGMSVAIVSGNVLLFEAGFGLADVENEVPASPQSIYRLASISKMLTGVAAMQLAEQGKLDLNSPVQRYVPGFPEKQAPITAELLLKHQSGIRHYRDDETHSAVFYNRVGDSLVIFKDDPLLFAPGEKYSYTTYGYNLLGAAIEAAAGQDYVTYVQEHIAAPAGMKTLQADSVHRIIPHRAAGYRIHGARKNGELRNDFAVDVSNKIPGGGWCSTAGDLGRFAIALIEGRLVQPATLERMWTMQQTADGKDTRSGLGCFIKVVDGDRQISHSGGQPKVSTFLLISPAHRAAVAVMCNLSGATAGKLAEELMPLVIASDDQR